MKLRVGDRFYPAAQIQSMTLLDTLEMQAALRDNPGISSARSMVDVLSLLDEFVSLPSRAEQLDYPEGTFLTAVTIWVTRRRAGERLPFLDAIDIPINDYEWVRESSDPELSAEGKALVSAAGVPRGVRRQGSKGKRKTSKRR